MENNKRLERMWLCLCCFGLIGVLVLVYYTSYNYHHYTGTVIEKRSTLWGYHLVVQDEDGNRSEIINKEDFHIEKYKPQVDELEDKIKKGETYDFTLIGFRFLFWYENIIEVEEVD